MKAADLLGNWHLLSIYSESEQGERNYHFGKDAVGRLAYHQDGYMSAMIMRLDRTRFSGEGIDDGSSAEIKEAFEGFEAYGGKYTLDLEAGTVTHHVDIARSPSWENTEQLRYFSIKEGILCISTPPMKFNGGTWRVHVRWERR